MGKNAETFQCEQLNCSEPYFDKCVTYKQDYYFRHLDCVTCGKNPVDPLPIVPCIEKSETAVHPLKMCQKGTAETERALQLHYESSRKLDALISITRNRKRTFDKVIINENATFHKSSKSAEQTKLDHTWKAVPASQQMVIYLKVAEYFIAVDDVLSKSMFWALYSQYKPPPWFMLTNQLSPAIFQ
ncbi:hypothetical protein HDU92_009089 [Lobulomyces angularis]|nr:hypothetical protein HDU92_009089 [Lobulomyces angularis]